MHELSGVLAARQGAQCGPRRHRHRARDPAQGLGGCDPWSAAPGVDLLVACELQTAQTCRLGGDGLDVCLPDDLRRRGGTHHRAEPAQVGRAPVGPPCIADIVPQQERFQTQLSRLQIPEGIFPRPTQVADRFILDGRDIDGSEVPGAHEPGQLYGVTTVGFDAVAGFFGY
jgi:hypothetical protein